MAENFTCSAHDLSRDNATELVWTLQVEDASHQQSVIAVAVFQIFILVVGIPLNTFVIGVILKNKLFYQPTHLLLLNLAVSDVLMCLLVMPFNIIVSFAGRFFLGSSDYVRCQFCHTLIIITVIMIYLSLFTVAAMSVDRLIYIKSPIRYPEIVTLKRMIRVMVMVWLLCICIGLPPVFGFGEIGYSKIVGTCSIIYSAETRVTQSVYYIILLVCVAIPPFITTAIANVWLLFFMCRALRGNFKRIMRNLEHCSSPSPLQHIQSVQKIESRYNRQQVFLAIVFGAIFVMNVVTWIPTVIIVVVSGIVGADNVPPETFPFIFLAFLSQPAIHPMLEIILVTKIREILWKCVSCRHHQRTQEEIV